MKTPSPKPAMAIIDTPAGDRLYLLCPVVPGMYQPAIVAFCSPFKKSPVLAAGATPNGDGSVQPKSEKASGVLRPSYVCPDLLESGSIYAEGGKHAVNAFRELQGIEVALKMMRTVWEGVLDNEPGSRTDLAQQKRLAELLCGPPEGSFNQIEKSGKLAKDGIPPKPENYIRNVYALAHWKGIWQIRHRKRACDPGGLAWDAAARMMNETCHVAFPDWKERRWTDFTGDSLKALIARFGLSPKCDF